MKKAQEVGNMWFWFAKTCETKRKKERERKNIKFQRERRESIVRIIAIAGHHRTATRKSLSLNKRP